MENKRLIRTLSLSLFITVISFANFTHLAGSENVKAIHIVTLLAAGAGIGMFIVSLAMIIRNRRKR